MIDLISRKKVIEALTDKVKQLREMAEGIETWDNTLIGSRIAGIEHAIMYLQTEPPFVIPESEDCVTVVRCKDCKYWDNVYNEYCWRLDVLGLTTDDFCSLGERREE